MHHIKVLEHLIRCVFMILKTFAQLLFNVSSSLDISFVLRYHVSVEYMGVCVQSERKC